MNRLKCLKLEKLNPSVKAALVLISVTLLSFQYRTGLNLAVFLTCIFLLVFFSNANLKHLAAILIPAFLAALGMFMTGLLYARGSSVTDAGISGMSTVTYAVRSAASVNLHTALQLGTRMLAYSGAGMLFALSTDGEYFISSLMHQCRLSPKFAYGILAAVHLMPNMVREFQNVKLAYRVRGMHAGAFSLKPVFTMLVNSIHWSESVALAMESKGFCGNSARTYYTVPKVRWYDWAFFVCGIGGIIIGMVI